MKTFLALLIVSTTCFAQRYSGSAGFGNVAHPGTPGIPQASSGIRTGARRVRPGVYPVFIGGGYYGSYYSDGSGYYGDNAGYGYAPQSSQPPVNVTVVNAPPQAPTVVINQNFVPRPDADQGDTTHVYQPAAPSGDTTGAEQQQTHYFLVAFKDHSVYSALAYWIEDKTLHYVTPQQTHNQASLDLIDLDFTNKLNQR